MELLEAHRNLGEGWLDTAARLEAEGRLTPEMRAEVDAGWLEVVESFRNMARAFKSATSSQERTASGSAAPRRPRKAGERSR